MLNTKFPINKTILLSSVAACFLIFTPSFAYAQDEVPSNSVIAEDMEEEFLIEDFDNNEIDIEPPQPTALQPSQSQEEPILVPHSGTFYDSSSFGTSNVGRTAPREVDPKYEPGSRYVTVTKTAGAGSFSSQLISAQRALKLGRYTAALEIYENLYRGNSKNARVLMGLAVAQQQSGFIESAIATYDELLKIDPNNKDATVNMIGLLSSQNPSNAYIILNEMWMKNNRNPGVAAQLGLTAAELGEYESAIKYLGIASSMEPNNPNHYYNMAVVSDRAGFVKQAIEFYQKTLELDVSTSGGRVVSRDVVYDRLATLRSL